MEEFILYWLSQAGPFSIIVSILLNVFISIFGFIPSVFLTAINITFFGFKIGLFISYMGECAGATISFFLYRKGIRYVKHALPTHSKYFHKLTISKGKEAFLIVLSLRLLPFMPSGLINLGAALSSIPLLSFTLASAIGKIPAMLLEAYSVNTVLTWEGKGKWILFIISLIILIIYSVKKKRA